MIESAAQRPRLKLQPRSKPLTSAVDEAAEKMRNTSIFGAGKPREARPEDFKDPPKPEETS